MKLPRLEHAIVPEQKLVNYLLSSTHPAGRGKAAFFGRFGFTAGTWETLAGALKTHAFAHEVTQTEDTPYGTSYTIDGPLPAPDGRTPLVRVVWFIGTGEMDPRLVTAYPLKGG